jgi:Trypsin-like peptidase domain
MMASISRSLLSRILFLAVTIGTPPLVGVADAQRAIPADNLAYPVLITLRNGSVGSGFYLQNGKAVYLVTAKHVLFDLATQKLLDVTADLISYSKDPADPTRNLLTLDLSALQNDGNVRPHPSEDVAVVKVFTLGSMTTGPGGAQTGPISSVHGVTEKERSNGGVLSVGADTVRPFDQVLTGNDVMVFGYPTSLGLQQLPKLDVQRPLLRKGIVAGTNRGKRSIILDCPSYFGNSGGPVLEVDREALTATFRVIGVISQYVPFVDTGVSRTFVMQMASNSGYSIATPMDFVLELVK